MLIIQFPYMEIVWLAFFWWRHKNFSSNFENLAQNFFVFFRPQIEFCTQTNIFRKNFFCTQNLIFCVHNVVLYTIMYTKVFVSCVRLQTQPKIFQKINLERKNQTFWFMENYLSYNFHLWKNVYHRDFIQCSVRMALYGIVWQEVSHIWELYDKKFRSSRAFRLHLQPCKTKVHLCELWFYKDVDKLYMWVKLGNYNPSWVPIVK